MVERFIPYSTVVISFVVISYFIHDMCYKTTLVITNLSKKS